MLFESAEIQVLRLCAWCKDLPIQGKSPHILYTGAGELPEILQALERPRERSRKVTTIAYKDAMGQFGCPVAILPLTADGMRQLRILSVPDYRQRLIRNILGRNYLPPENSFADARSKTEDFIIGIDCNILRFENAVKAEKPTNLFVLPFQAEAAQALTAGSKVNCFVLDLPQTEAFLGLPPDLPGIDRAPFQTGKGEYVHVPSFGSIS